MNIPLLGDAIFLETVTASGDTNVQTYPYSPDVLLGAIADYSRECRKRRGGASVELFVLGQYVTPKERKAVRTADDKHQAARDLLTQKLNNLD